MLTRERIEDAAGEPPARRRRDVAARPRHAGSALRADGQAAPDGAREHAADGARRCSARSPLKLAVYSRSIPSGVAPGGRAPAHAGTARAGGARIVFGPARTRPRGRASDLGRRAAARSRMGRGSRSARPRGGILIPIIPILEPFGMTVNSKKSAARRWALRPWPRRCCVAACGGSGEPTTHFHATPGDRLRRRIEPASSTRATTPTATSTASTRRCRRPTRRSICGVNAIWIAERRPPSYGLVFPECNPAGDRGRRAAEPDPRRASAPAPPTSAAQIDAQQAESALRAGRHGHGADRRATMSSPSTPQYPARQRGPAHRQRRGRTAREVGRQVNRMTDTGAKVHARRPSSTSASRPMRRAETSGARRTPTAALLLSRLSQNSTPRCGRRSSTMAVGSAWSCSTS